MSYTISIIGTDPRLWYAGEKLLASSGEISLYHLSGQSCDPPKGSFLRSVAGRISDCASPALMLQKTDFLLCPVPFTKDRIHLNGTELSIKDFYSLLNEYPADLSGGAIPCELSELLKKHNKRCIDFLKDEGFAEYNAGLTAEGLLRYLIEGTPGSIDGAKILLTGLGRCGRKIADKLQKLGAEIYFYDSSPEQISFGLSKGFLYYDLKHAAEITPSPSFDLLINTVPAPIFKGTFLRLLPESCACFDIASAPGGFDGDLTAGLGIHVTTVPSIPGRTAPKAAGLYMADYLSARNYLRKD